MGLSPQDTLAKSRVGVVLQETKVPPNLKVNELVKLIQSYYSNSNSTQEILQKVNLEDKSKAWASGLSGGQKQRLYFALALAGDPELLILDEPTRNLDDKGYEEFWKQIQLCREQGITIVMVTNNKSDWNELNQLATHYVTLHKLAEAPASGQLAQNIDAVNNHENLTNAQSKKISQYPPSIQTQSLFNIFLQQFWVEFIQLMRTPIFLLGLVIFAGLINFFPFQGEQAKQPLTYFSMFILLTVAIERIGKRVSVERAEGWLKLLRITPLPPIIYVAAKVSTTLLLCSFSLTLVLIAGILHLGIETNLGQILTLFLSLVFGAVPFTVLALALSYLTEPKSYDSIVGLSIPVGIATCGIPSLSNSRFLQDLAAFSPFYHYRELGLWAVGLDYDKHLLLHLLWLVWASGAFGLIAIWAYQRDSAIQ